MDDDQKVAVFASFRPFQHILTIFDSNNFQNQPSHIYTRNMLQAITVAFFGVCYVVAMSSNAWFCVSRHFEVGDIALAFGVLINAMQFAITYITIRVKNETIVELITDIDEIINKRECSQYASSLYSALVHGVLFFYVFSSIFFFMQKDANFPTIVFHTMSNWR